jgi:hypothetical protein
MLLLIVEALLALVGEWVTSDEARFGVPDCLPQRMHSVDRLRSRPVRREGGGGHENSLDQTTSTVRNKKTKNHEGCNHQDDHEKRLLAECGVLQLPPNIQNVTVWRRLFHTDPLPDVCITVFRV